MIFGIGTDIVEVERIQQALDQFGTEFVKRILSVTEQEEYAETKLQARFLAKRFAAKEAFSKAFGTGIRGAVNFQNISITHDKMGKPMFRLAPELETVLVEKNIGGLHVSISDEKNLAVAYVVIEHLD